VLKRVRPLDAAIIVAVVLILAVAGYLGYRLWANENSLRKDTPAGREIEVLKEQLRKSPNNINARMKLAQAFSVAGRTDEAVQQYEAILKANKEFVPALSGLGFEFMKQKEWAEGEKYFQKVISLTEDKTPTSASGSPLEVAYYYIGISRMERKDYSAAAGYLKKALSMKQSSSDTAYALAVCYKHLNIMDGYSDTLQYALQFDPKMPEANYDYGMLLLSQGDTVGAAEHFRTSSDAAPYKAEPRDQLNKLGSATDRFAKASQLASKDASAALAEARISAAIDPESLPTLQLVAQLYEKMKKKAEAQAVYEKILLIDPENKIATEGLKRVKDGS
jgi:tetratricopeptide (TPR) repeat protein